MKKNCLYKAVFFYLLLSGYTGTSFSIECPYII